MSFEPTIPQSKHTWIDRTIFGLAVIAGLIASYLAYQSFSQGKLIGCGSDNVFSCDEVLGTSWAKVLGLPVALAGAGIYLVIATAAGTRLFVRTIRSNNLWLSVLVVAAFAAASSGIWFTLLQFFHVGKLCKYCLATHACGLAIACLLTFTQRASTVHQATQAINLGPGVPTERTKSERGLPPARFAQLALAGTIATVVMATIQILMPTAGHEVSKLAPNALDGLEFFSSASAGDDSANAESEPSDTVQPATVGPNEVQDSTDHPTDGANTNVSSAGSDNAVTEGRFDNALLVGNRNAEHAIVEILDYTCVKCRTLYPTLEHVIEQFPEQVAIVVAPIGADRECNPHYQSEKRNEISCKHARLAVAVWQIDRGAFPKFHRWMMEGELKSVSDAWDFAANLIGEDALASTFNSEAVTSRLEVNSRVWRDMGKLLPILLVNGNKIQGEVADLDQLEQMIIQYLPVQESP